MLSYRHGFHAGNHADVLKHLVLVESLHNLLKKPSPILYIDTHAGAGHYDFSSAMATKTAEAAAGVLKLDFDTLPTSVSRYANAVQPYLAAQHYPGSPLLAADLLRKSDQLRLFELHSSETKALQALFARDRRVKLSASDGFSSLKALLPVQNARALVLMDPSYEIKTDYQQVAKSLVEGYTRMPHANFLLWYPVVQRPWVEAMIAELLKHQVKDCWRFELGMAPDSDAFGMSASGMLAINPPWFLADQLRELLPAIQQQLAPAQGYYRVEQLSAE